MRGTPTQCDVPTDYVRRSFVPSGARSNHFILSTGCARPDGHRDSLHPWLHSGVPLGRTATPRADLINASPLGKRGEKRGHSTLLGEAQSPLSLPSVMASHPTASVPVPSSTVPAVPGSILFPRTPNPPPCSGRVGSSNAKLACDPVMIIAVTAPDWRGSVHDDPCPKPLASCCPPVALLIAPGTPGKDRAPIY